jgi:hypothetical protein
MAQTTGPRTMPTSPSSTMPSSPSSTTNAAGTSNATGSTMSAADCKALFKKLDVNHDGKITKDALTPYPELQQAFSDDSHAQKRGYMTAHEFKHACEHGASQQ